MKRASAHSVEVETAVRAVNPAVALLLRAGVKAFLVRIGEQSAEDAVADLFPPCACAREIYERMERHPHNPTIAKKERPPMQAPEATVNAVEYETRNDGVAALATPGFKRRWVGLSAAQKLEIIVRLNWQRAKWPKVDDQLIQRLVESSK